VGTPICFSQDSQALIFNRDFLLPKYVLLYMGTAVQVFKHISRGTTISGVTKKQLNDLEFRLPPLPEQKRIVEEIEKQFTRLDAAVAALKRVQANLKRYGAAVLKVACEGRLVPTEAELARRENRSYEPASALLESTLAERRIGWEAKQLVKNKKQYEEPESPDSTALGPLPDGWVWTNLGQLKLFSIYGPRFSSDDYTNEGTVVLRTTDISEEGKVDLDSAPKLKLSAGDFEKYKLVPGDLVFTRTGATIGKTAIFNDAVHAIPGAYLIHYRLATRAATAWYVYRFFQSVVGQTYLLAGRLGIGQPNLNAPTIEAIPIPLPPSAEQRRILEAINTKLTVVEKEMSQVSDSCRRADRLRQSILKRAFEGKLVPQNPNDESASTLLERIRGEREVESRGSRKGAKEIVTR
jgi:type I restriction enzyme S subunit